MPRLVLQVGFVLYCHYYWMETRAEADPGKQTMVPRRRHLDRLDPQLLVQVHGRITSRSLSCRRRAAMVGGRSGQYAGSFSKSNVLSFFLVGIEESNQFITMNVENITSCVRQRT
jgi:hypothetical protein